MRKEQNEGIMRRCLPRGLVVWGVWLLVVGLLPRYVGGQEVLQPALSLEASSSRATSGTRGGTVRQGTMLTLPFFDDFAYQGSSVHHAFWKKGSGVTVHRSGAYGAPTPGVARFDVIGADGMLPSRLVSERYGVDTLESLPIELPDKKDTTIYLSFQYQAGGYADPPHAGDTLYLDFYEVSSAQWHVVWSVYREERTGALVEHYCDAVGTERWVRHEEAEWNKQFWSVHLPVRGVRWVRSGFRYRFRSVLSVQYDRLVPSRAAASSLWHVDLVYLASGRSYRDTTVYDVAIDSLGFVQIGGYSQVPMSAFRTYWAQGECAVLKDLSFQYRNLEKRTLNVRRDFYIHDLRGVIPERIFLAGNENLPPLSSMVCKRSVSSYPWEDLLSGDSMYVTIKGVITTDTTKARWPFKFNDTLEQRLEYKDEYAYDVGAPDQGYGVVGLGAERAKVCMAFPLVDPITVHTVRIWYNAVLDQNARGRQQLVIWRDEGGMPGQEIYHQAFEVPADNDSLGRFLDVKLDQPLLLHGVVYVGWRQSSGDFVNVGFDMQTPLRPAIFYQTRGVWQPSQLPGALMIRLVCGGAGATVELLDDQMDGLREETQVCTLYPNPCAIRFMVQSTAPIERVTLYDMQGRALREYAGSMEGYSVEGLPEGIYWVRVQRGYGLCEEMLQLKVTGRCAW